MTSRLFHMLFSLIVIILSSPIIIFALLSVFFYDFKNPLYFAKRVGQNGKQFIMIKIRTMSVARSSNEFVSTSADDTRITPIGILIRKYKLDELVQFLNVIFGSMSIVGPRPLPKADYDQLNDFEQSAYDLLPGITDFSSIIFSDEGEILRGYDDADFAYNQIIRPWKSCLVHLYKENKSLRTDIYLIFLTALTLFDKKKAITYIYRFALRVKASNQLLDLIPRQGPVPQIKPPTRITNIMKEKK